MDRRAIKQLGFQVRTNESLLYINRNCVVCGVKLPPEHMNPICPECDRKLETGKLKD